MEEKLLDKFKNERIIYISYRTDTKTETVYHIYSNKNSFYYPRKLNEKLDILFKENFIQINFGDIRKVKKTVFESSNFEHYINKSILEDEIYEIHFKYDLFQIYEKREDKKPLKYNLINSYISCIASNPSSHMQTYMYKKVTTACITFIDKIDIKDLLKLKNVGALDPNIHSLLKEYKKTKSEDVLASLNLIIECED